MYSGADEEMSGMEEKVTTVMCFWNLISPLSTKLISLMVLYRLFPLSFTCISTSARSYPKKLDPQHSIVKAIWEQIMLLKMESCLKKQKTKMESLQGERTIFYLRLYKKAEERAIQRWPIASFPGPKKRRKGLVSAVRRMCLIISDLTMCGSVGGCQWRLQSYTVDCMTSLFTISNQCRL